MADYWASARTNYFKVKDLDEFRAAIERLHRHFGHEVLKIVEHRDNDTICLLDETERGWSWISSELPARHEDLAGFVAPHIADGWVAEFREVGAEKLRYLHGTTVAINNRGERVELQLDDIYDQAAKLGGNLTRAEY